jgi:hypothetical protein
VPSVAELESKKAELVYSGMRRDDYLVVLTGVDKNERVEDGLNYDWLPFDEAFEAARKMLSEKFADEPKAKIVVFPKAARRELVALEFDDGDEKAIRWLTKNIIKMTPEGVRREIKRVLDNQKK